MVVLLIRSAGTAFHSPAFSAATPMIVPKEELTKCAGYTQTMQAVSAIISPAAAAFLYAVWPLNAIILLDIVGAILASGGNYQIRTNHYAFTAVPVNKSTCKRA